jgi:hypothetical protein
MKMCAALLVLFAALGAPACALEMDEAIDEEEVSSVSQEMRGQWEFYCGPCHGETGPGVVVLDDTGDNFYCYGGLGMVQCGVNGTWCNICW